MRVRLVWTTLALVLALAGCGGGEGDGDQATAGGSGATATTAAAPTVPGGGASSEDEQKAKDIVLKASDFPPGWTSTPPDEDDDEEEVASEEFEACLGVSVADDDRPDAESPTFSKGQLTQVRSSAELAATTDEVATDFEALQSPKLNQCVEQQLDKELKSQSGDVRFAPAKASKLDFPSLGEGSLAVRLTTSVSAEGQQVPIYADFVFVKKGRVEITITYINAGEPFDATLAADLARKSVSRA